MKNPFKKWKEKREKREAAKRSNFTVGLAAGIAVAAVVVVVVALVVYFGVVKKQPDKNPNNNTNQTNQGPANEKAALRITVVTSKNCQGCFDINLFLTALRQNNIEEKGLETLYIEDSKTKSLVDKYKITKVPTVLIAGELDKNPILKQAWPALGEVVDGVFVLRESMPPYLEVASGQIKGKFSVILLDDKSCDKCYDVELHNTALTNLGMQSNDIKTIDVSSDEGKELVKKYSIKAVPTLLLQGELGEYKNLQQVWPQVGEVADDGTYVFTALEEMGTYKDLTKNKVIEVKKEATAATGATAVPANQ